MDNKDELLQEMYNNALVITPNNRLSAQLLAEFANKYINNHPQTKPLCLPYQSFLQYLFKKVQHNHPNLDHPLLLSPLQERYLWKNIICGAANQNIQNAIQEAWNRCRTWQVSLDAHEFQITNQCQLSQDLQIKYHQELQKQNLLSQAMVVNYIIKYLNLRGEKIIWACFDDYTPAQSLLQDNLTTHNNQIIHFDLQKPRANCLQYIAKDLSDEYQAMLAWLNTRIAANDGNIAVVVPNIAEQGQNILRFLQKHMPKITINISLGESLDNFLIIKHAITWLMLDEQTIPQSTARLLLNSPFLAGGQAEFNRRAELAENCKLLCKPQVNLNSLRKECSKNAPFLAEILTNFSPYPVQACPSEWVKIFAKRLSEFAFPGEYPLSSQNYQCLQRLQEVFLEFKKLAIFDEKMDKSQAISTLNELIQQSIFQPQTTQAQINILGLLEASGCTFKSMWVCGLTDRCLPSKTNLSAFIPIELQTKLLMPHAASARELQFAKQQLRRLQSSCDNIVLSYSSFIEDIPMLGSPLLQGIKQMPKSQHNSVTHPPKASNIQLKTYLDDYKLPVQDFSTIKGGTSLLARQAKCPFMAFAKHRLVTSCKEDIYDWPNNLERGQILHKALEIIWQKIGAQTNLKNMCQDEIACLCSDVVTEVVTSEAPDNNDKLNSVIITGEIERLSQLTCAAIIFDLSRPEFKINAVEKSFIHKLDALEFKIRVDRIDDVISHDEQIIIDYKSSLPSSKPWKEERPLEPQLLLYALLDPKVSCIMYLQLKNGKVIASGVSAEDLNIEGVKAIKADEDWEDYKKIWQTQLTSLANEFSRGVCLPQPTKLGICQTCDFQDLCRFTVSA